MSERAPTALTPDYVPALDGLRGLLALSVAVYHFSSWTHLFGSGTRASSAVAVLGIYSVEGFFIISGFCFFHLYGQSLVRGRALYGFLIKRYLRIAPLYYLALALNWLLDRPVGPMTLERVVENLTLSFGFFHPNHARVLGGWSIGIEYVFYLSFPVLVWVVQRRPALYLVTLALMALAYLHANAAQPTESIWIRFDRYVELPNHAFLFLWGGVIADLRRKVSARLPTWALVLAVSLLVVLCASQQGVFQDHFEVMAGLARVRLLAACFVLSLLVAFHAPGTGVFGRPLRWLGDHSYAVYLLHPFASFVVLSWLSVERSPLGVFALGMLLTLLFAALSRVLIERPAIELGKRLAA